MTNFIKSFVADQSGASAAEYALILAIVGAGIGAAAFALGSSIKNSMGAAATKINDCSVGSTATC